MKINTKNNATPAARSPWFWVPSLYFAEGIPYVIVMMVSVIMYKRLGISNTDIALYTSWLYLPWVIKPLWSPVVDILRTKRFWIITMQLVIGAGLGAVALTIPLPSFFKITLGFLWLLAFSSATHDIAADGFYMHGLSQHDQAWFVGVRSTFYRFAMITGQGLLIILAGFIESHSGLARVEVTVTADPAREVVELLPPQALEILPGDGNLRIVCVPEHLELATAPRPRAWVDSVLKQVNIWNADHGFVPPPVQAAAGPGSGASWWTRSVAAPLESFLRQNFGQAQPQTDAQGLGNIGIVHFHLSRPPNAGERIVVNFGRKYGDKSIALVAGERFEFTSDNWNQPARALIQVDPKLRQASEAGFAAQSGNIPLAWSVTFLFLAGLFVLFFIYHKIMLPFPASDRPARTGPSSGFFSEFLRTFLLFFQRPKIVVGLAFLLLYRLGESQLVKLASPFLLDTQEMGGLALTTGQVGFVYGTVGILSLTAGGLLGGFLAARHGLKFWLWFMAVAINLPDVVYIYLSYALPENFWIINLCVAIEQFGYGFGFTAYMLFMILISEGEHKTAHFAITTAFMALGMMIPGMFSGWLQEIIGYRHFFIWVTLATIPGFLILPFLPIDPEFGKKHNLKE